MTATDPTNIPDPGAPQGLADRITTTEAHNHSGESKVWCETCQHTHIASIPEDTYACHSCGFGSWHSETATEHESLCPGHETYPLGHIVRALPDRPSDLALSPRMESEREALLDLLRTEVPSYVDSPSAMWGAAHVLLIARREAPAPAPVTVTVAQVDAAYRSVPQTGGTASAFALLAALGITVTDSAEPTVAELQAEAQRLCDADRIYEDGDNR